MLPVARPKDPCGGRAATSPAVNGRTMTRLVIAADVALQMAALQRRLATGQTRGKSADTRMKLYSARRAADRADSVTGRAADWQRRHPYDTAVPSHVADTLATAGSHAEAGAVVREQQQQQGPRMRGSSTTWPWCGCSSAAARHYS